LIPTDKRFEWLQDAFASCGALSPVHPDDVGVDLSTATSVRNGRKWS